MGGGHWVGLRGGGEWMGGGNLIGLRGGESGWDEVFMVSLQEGRWWEKVFRLSLE